MENRRQIKIDCINIHHDDELDKLLQTSKPISLHFAMEAEREIFSFMREWKIWKIYVWDDFHSTETTSRWDWCFAPIQPENKACREHNFANLVAMDDWQFERLVRSLPKSPNENIVREWRDVMRKDPLIINAAKSEAPPMDWSDLKFDPDLIKKVIKKELL